MSKSILRLSCHELANEQDIHYFPSYEILMDDLRDYRFYNDDMIHPTEKAKQYVRDFFSKCLFDNETQLLNKKINKIITATNHRPFNQESSEHQKFIRKTLKEIEDLPKELDFSKEKSDLIKQIV